MLLREEGFLFSQWEVGRVEVSSESIVRTGRETRNQSQVSIVEVGLPVEGSIVVVGLAHRQSFPSTKTHGPRKRKRIWAWIEKGEDSQINLIIIDPLSALLPLTDSEMTQQLITPRIIPHIRREVME